jgi:hypothetical protein
LFTDSDNGLKLNDKSEHNQRLLRPLHLLADLAAPRSCIKEHSNHLPVNKRSGCSATPASRTCMAPPVGTRPAHTVRARPFADGHQDSNPTCQGVAAKEDREIFTSFAIVQENMGLLRVFGWGWCSPFNLLGPSAEAAARAAARSS